MVNYISFSLIFTLISLTFFQVSSLTQDDTNILPSPHSLPLLSHLAKPPQVGGSCAYQVQIKTECSSVSYTRDQISLSFGDASGTQVYVPRIDDPKSGTFEACSTDTFDISGPCTRDVCYVYLYRRGHDGWNVGSVKISSKRIRTVTFNFKSWLPSDTWYGFNYCKGRLASSLM